MQGKLSETTLGEIQLLQSSGPCRAGDEQGDLKMQSLQGPRGGPCHTSEKSAAHTLNGKLSVGRQVLYVPSAEQRGPNEPLDGPLVPTVLNEKWHFPSSQRQQDWRATGRDYRGSFKSWLTAVPKVMMYAEPVLRVSPEQA